jgi:CBS domain containing-hemolysin-like protein
MGDFIDKSKDGPYLVNEYNVLGYKNLRSGYLIHKNEAIPRLRQVIHLTHFDAEILSVSDTRIEKVKIKIH